MKMRTTQARTISRSFAVLLGIVFVAGCSSSSSSSEAFGGPCSGKGPCTGAPGIVPSPAAGITVENRSGADVTLVAQEPRKLRVDHDIVEGALDVPFPDQLFVDRRELEVRAGTLLHIGQTEIDVATSGGETDVRAASFVGVAGGPRMLALGTGKLFVRVAADGSRVLEPEDPKTLTLVPSDRALPACAAGAVDDGFTIAAGDGGMLSGAAPAPVTAITRDAEGCRVFTVEDTDGSGATLRVCIPDAVYPFADADTLALRVDDASASLGATWRLENQSGTAMRLVHTVFADRMTGDVESLGLTAAHAPTCARIAGCGSLDVPASLTYAFGGGAPSAVSLGAPLVDPSDPSLTYVVLRARARPVANRTCVSESDATTDDARAHAWLALITKPSP